MNFNDLLLRNAPRLGNPSEPFAELLYSQEVRFKNDALKEFWAGMAIGGRLQPLVEAVMPRGYRTTTKRRSSFNEQRGFALDFAERPRPGVCTQSILEPDSHNKIYQQLFDKIDSPAYKPFARVMNWVVIRGSYTQHCVIFNVTKLDAVIVRKAKQLAEWLPTLGLGITAAMLYVDPSRSDYYLEAERPDEGLDTKHLFGPRLLTLAVEDLRLKYPPTVFSQVNESMVPVLVKNAREMLGATDKDRMLDLYCGYGLFSFALGQGCREVLALEIAGDSIATAQGTAQRLGVQAKLRFQAVRIQADSLAARLPMMKPGDSEVILLDPPRRGADAGVIALLAARRPRRVLQICCGTDEIVPAVNEWKRAGYRVEEARPLDLFPGTANLETLIALVPDASR